MNAVTVGHPSHKAFLCSPPKPQQKGSSETEQPQATELRVIRKAGEDPPAEHYGMARYGPFTKVKRG